MKISPELIPHDQFYKGIWLLSVKRPEWYYFMELENKNEITNGHFMETVDEPLKELVSFLHSIGIKTTPSCAGHHKSEKNFKKIYDALEKDKDEIKKEGLQLKDIQSGEIYIYKNKTYDLPWNKKQFLSKVSKYQGNGVIGIRLDGDEKIEFLKLSIPGVKIVEEKGIVFIYTDEKTTEEINGKWKIITREIKNIFKTKLVFSERKINLESVN